MQVCGVVRLQDRTMADRDVSDLPPLQLLVEKGFHASGDGTGALVQHGKHRLVVQQPCHGQPLLLPQGQGLPPVLHSLVAILQVRQSNGTQQLVQLDFVNRLVEGVGHLGAQGPHHVVGLLGHVKYLFRRRLGDHPLGHRPQAPKAAEDTRLPSAVVTSNQQGSSTRQLEREVFHKHISTRSYHIHPLECHKVRADLHSCLLVLLPSLHLLDSVGNVTKPLGQPLIMVVGGVQGQQGPVPNKHLNDGLDHVPEQSHRLGVATGGAQNLATKDRGQHKHHHPGTKAVGVGNLESEVELTHRQAHFLGSICNLLEILLQPEQLLVGAVEGGNRLGVPLNHGSVISVLCLGPRRLTVQIPDILGEDPLRALVGEEQIQVGKHPVQDAVVVRCVDGEQGDHRHAADKHVCHIRKLGGNGLYLATDSVLGICDGPLHSSLSNMVEIVVPQVGGHQMIAELASEVQGQSGHQGIVSPVDSSAASHNHCCYLARASEISAVDCPI
mmetsp:Transcript_46041/g.98426  ORF Transcript_46041/g.98426 Transcript_46041/m.98426 type:complete len:498 (+) Transcript_46041:2044-3537(+)